jgi:hypothetical protein
MFFRLVIPALAARKAAEVIACFSEFDGVAHYSFVRYFIAECLLLLGMV